VKIEQEGDFAFLVYRGEIALRRSQRALGQFGRNTVCREWIASSSSSSSSSNDVMVARFVARR